MTAAPYITDALLASHKIAAEWIGALVTADGKTTFHVKTLNA